MAVCITAISFFFDVVHILVRGQLAVSSDDAAAAECGKAEEPNDATHTSSVARGSNYHTLGTTVAGLHSDNSRLAGSELKFAFLVGANQLLGDHASKALEVERALSGGSLSRKDNSVSEGEMRD